MDFLPMIRIGHEIDLESSLPAALSHLDEAVDAVFVMLWWGVFCIRSTVHKNTNI